MGNINVNYAPLTKGAIRNIAEDEIPIGAWYDANGFTIEQGKFKTYPKWRVFNDYAAYDDDTYGRAVDFVQFTDTIGSPENFIITTTSILKDSGSGWVVQTPPRDETPTSTPLTFNFRTSVQWTIGRDADGAALWIADGTNPLLKYSFATDTWTEVLTYFTAVRSVLYHDSRLWVAGPTTTQGTMMWWSNLNQPDTFATISYMYFPERTLPITRLKTLGQFLVIYFPDAVYVGQASGNPLLPYSFTDSQMRLVGLKGPYAISDWQNGHLFLSKKGVFWLRPDRVIQEIECPIYDILYQEPTKVDNFYVITAPLSDDFYIGAPTGYLDECGRILHYCTASQGWTYWETHADCLLVRQSQSTIDWGGDTHVLTVDNYSFDGTQTSQAELIALFEAIGVYGGDDFLEFVSEVAPSCFVDGKNYLLSASAVVNGYEPNALPTLVLETGDITFNEVDLNKTITRLRMRTTASGDQSWTLHGSIDKGVNWKDLGTFTVEATDEASINFRLTGAECRLRLVCNGPSLPQYEIRDLSLRIRSRGLETT